MSTIKDVAKLAGVGTSSVSRFYNGGSLSETKKIAITNAIKELNYIPNESAKALKQGSLEIAIIVERIKSHTVSRFLESFIQRADSNNLKVSVYTSNFDIVKKQKIIDGLVKRGVKQIFIMPFNDIDFGYPDKIVIIGQASEYYKSLSYDESDAIYRLLDYIDVSNYKYTAIIGYEINDPALAKRVEIASKYFIKHSLDVECLFLKFGDIDLNSLELKDNGYYFCMTDELAHRIYFMSLELKINVRISGFGDYTNSKYMKIPSIKTDFRAVVDYCFEGLEKGFTSEIVVADVEFR